MAVEVTDEIGGGEAEVEGYQLHVAILSRRAERKGSGVPSPWPGRREAIRGGCGQNIPVLHAPFKGEALPTPLEH
jgi:hypothetical protein